LLGKNFLKTNIVTARSKAILLKNLAKRMMGMHVVPYEVEVVTKDGEKLPYEVNAMKIQYEGKPADMVVFRDLSARKKLQEELVESEERYRRQFEEALDAIILADAETGILIDCNRAASELVGRARSELVGRHQRILHPPEKIEAGFSKTFKQHLKEKEGQVLETQVIAKNGEIKDVAIKANVFELKDQKLIQGTFRDITQRKKMEDERKHFQKRLSALNKHGQSLNRATSMEEIYTLTLKTMDKTLGFEYASILIRQGKMLRLVSQRGYSNQFSLNLPLNGEKGVTVKAAKTGNPVLVPDNRKEKAYVLGKPNMLSELAVPVKVGDKVLGILNVESERLAAFNERDSELLEILASQAAIAISNLKKQKQLKRLSNKMKHLMKSTTEIMHIKDMQERLRAITKAIRKFGWRRVVISLRDENLEGEDVVTAGLTKEEIKLLIERKAPGHVWKERLGPKFGQFKIGEFYYLPWNNPWIREYVHDVPPEAPVEKATTYAGVPSTLPLEEMVDWHPQDMLYAPLRTPKGRIVGILSMDDPVDGRKPTRESLTPLELFLHQAAIVIENAQLIEGLREARKQLETYAGQLEQKVEERTRELKKSQQKLLKAQRLAVIGELAGMVGHDLRNPLTGIAGATYYLKKRLSSKLDKKTNEMLELMENNIVYSNKIINDLLDYSRELKLDLTVSDPKSIIGKSLSVVKIPKNVQVTDLTEKKPKIRVDVGKMKRAFVNLIKNSVDAMPKGGTLTIKAKKLDGNLEFVFSDTGVGMSKKSIEKLWTPLFTTKAKGMGFGLPICKRVIEAHGGSVSVKSARAKGTTFTITIPTKPKTEGGEKIWVKPLESSLLMTTKA
jgi:PAS domain S-box-containing protein